MATIYHQVWINAPKDKVYEAISTAAGISSWWSKTSAVETGNVTVLEFNPGGEHGVLKASVVDPLPCEHIEWKFFSTHPDSSPASAWTDTNALFEITEREPMSFMGSGGKLTVLDFHHSGWDETNKYFGFCNYGWGEALRNLKLHCEEK